MRGAIAAGHALTAAAGARVLEEGGNAVDACVAAGIRRLGDREPAHRPGCGRLRARRSRATAARRGSPTSSWRRRAGGAASPERRPMHAIDVGFGGDSETTQVFRIGEASCAVPGAAAGLEAAAPRATDGCPGASSCSRRSSSRATGVELTPAAGAPARDPRPDPAPQRRGPPSLQPRRRLPPASGRSSAAPRPRRARSNGSRRRALAALYTGELAACDRRHGGGRVVGCSPCDDLSSYRVVWRRPVRVPYRGHEVDLEPAAVVGRDPDRLRARAARAARRRGAPGSAEAIAALIGVMREQTRARGDGFDAALHRGGLARRLLSPEALAAAVARIEAEAPGVTEHRPAGGTTHVSVVDGDGNAASLSSSTGSGSGVIVPGTGIHLNNMLGEYDLVGGAARDARSAADEHDGADDRARCDRATARRRERGLGAPARRDHAGDRRTSSRTASVSRQRSTRRACTSTSRTSTARAASILQCSNRLESWGYDVVRWRRRNLFFGGTNAVEVLPDTSLAAAGDARRGGDGLVVA